MGILSRIAEAKAKFRQIQEHRREVGMQRMEQQNIQLKKEAAIKTENVRYKERLLRAEEKTRKIKSKTGLRGAIKRFKETKKRQPMTSGGVFMQGSSGLQVGGSRGGIFGGSGKHSTFSFGPEKKPIKKQQKSILIRL